MISDSGLEDGEGPGGELVLLELCDFVFGKFVTRFREQLSGRYE